ncbi:MAG: hypothetical protein JW955_03230 [Sedimentisphaerales bacterium]|nr:hypothetical protein [Sedimentisphaerales bacterium]
MRDWIVLIVLAGLMIGGTGWADEPTVAPVTHRQLQAVDASGVGTYAASDKVTITGVILNNPEEILDPAPGPDTGYMGGQWQIYVQGQGEDHGGTAVYMGQYYAKVGGSGNYGDEDWLAELSRIDHDPNTGYTFAAGDKVRVTGWYKFYKGKINVNEKHQVESLFDLRIELVEPAAGLPQPGLIILDMVKDANNQFLFDQARLTGCEYYQGTLVRVNDVNVVDPNGWGPDGTIEVMDKTGRSFPVKLGIGYGFTRYACPTGQISVIGIFDQESSGYMVCQDGYRLWVPNYDGNGLVLTDRGHRRGNQPCDVSPDSGSLGE